MSVVCVTDTRVTSSPHLEDNELVTSSETWISRVDAARQGQVVLLRGDGDDPKESEDAALVSQGLSALGISGLLPEPA